MKLNDTAGSQPENHQQLTVDSTRFATSITAVIAVTVLHGMIHGYSIFLSPLNDQMRQFFGTDSIGAITAMKTTYLVVYAGGNLMFGLLTNRLSPRGTLAAGMILNGSAVAAFSVVGPDGIGLMHVLWSLAGIGASVYHPIANALITRLYPTRKGMVLGVSGVGAAVGFAFAPLATSLLAGTVGLAWQQIALLFGTAGIVVGVAAWFAIPSVRQVSTIAAETARSEVSPQMTRENRSSLGVLALTMVIGVACLREIAMWSIIDISDFFLTLVLADSTRTGFFLFLFYLPGIFVKPLIGITSDRVGRKTLASAALMFYGVTIAAAGVVGPLGLVPIYLLMGTGQAATIPSIEAIIADGTSDRNRGLVFGVFVTVGTGLGALGPLISGGALDALGGTLPAFRLWAVTLGSIPLIGGVILAALRFPVRENLQQGAQDNFVQLQDDSP